MSTTSPPWSIQKSAALLEFVTSGSRGWAQYYSESGPAFVRIGNLDHDTIALDMRDVQCVSPPSNAEGARTRLRPGDILISITAELGMVGLVPEDLGEAYINQHIALARPKSGVDPRYLAWFFASEGKQQLLDMRRGMTKAGLGLDDIRNVDVVVPPLSEQRRIVGKLEALQSRSRRAREALDAVPLLLEKLRQSILAAAFRGDLTKDWRAQNPNPEPASALLARVRTERRQRWEASELTKFKAKGKSPTNDSWKAKYKDPEPIDAKGLPGLPEGWCWATIETVGDVLLGRRRADAEYVAGVDGRVLRPYVRVANVREDYLDLSDILEMPFSPVELETYRLQPGDIILSEGQSAELIGRSATYEGGREDLCIQATVHRFRALPSATTSAFAQLVFLHHLHTGVFRSASALTTNIAHLTSERLRPLRFPLPPLAEQGALVERARAALAAVTSLVEKSQEIARRESVLQRALLAKAFRGKLVSQDLNDEPADDMLARLRNEALVDSSRRRSSRSKAAE
jgi:type I restriction enzyme, S subunit